MIRSRSQRWMVPGVTAGVLVAATALAIAAAGNFDTGFGVGGIVREPGLGGLTYAWTTAVQGDGKILAAGSDQNDFRVRRYLADGADDPGFGTGGVVSLFDTNGGGTAHPTVYDLAVDGYGRIVCAGVGAVSNLPRATVVRLRSDGSLDPSFGTGGVVHFNDALSAAAGTGARSARVYSLVAVALQADGKVVVTGRLSLEVGRKGKTTYQDAIFLARLHSTGVLDNSFGIGGLVVHDRTTENDAAQIDSVGIQSDGKIVVGVIGGPSITLSDLAAGKAWVITRYLPTGAVDTAFGSILGANRFLIGLTVDASDRILVSGRLAFDLVTNDVVVARYLPGGALDANFGSGGSCVFGPNAKDQAMSTPAVMADGRIVFSVLLRPSTTDVPHAVRLTAAGALDGSFGSAGISDPLQVGDLSNFARSVSIAPDGDVIVSGRAVFDNGAAANTFEWVIARYQGN